MDDGFFAKPCLRARETKDLEAPHAGKGEEHHAWRHLGWPGTMNSTRNRCCGNHRRWGSNQPRCQMNGKPTIMLSANKYLNLTTHPRVVAAMQEATTTYGAGSGSVRPLRYDGHPSWAEKKVAEFKGVEASLIYSAGYTVNVGLIHPRLGPKDVIIPMVESRFHHRRRQVDKNVSGSLCTQRHG